MYFIYVRFAFLSCKECHLLLKAFHQVWLLSKVLPQVNLFFNYCLKKMKQSKRHFNNFYYFYCNHSDHFLMSIHYFRNISHSFISVNVKEQPLACQICKEIWREARARQNSSQVSSSKTWFLLSYLPGGVIVFWF